MVAKFNISMDESLLAKIDKLADENFTSRSGFISMGMNEFVKQKEVVSAITGMADSLSHISQSSVLDDETKKELERFRTLAQYLSRQ
jgi:metal-responsive CopG/Arc/MetJ family transcriptional regulator